MFEFLLSQAILANDALWGRDLSIALALCLGQCSGPGLSIPAFYPQPAYICRRTLLAPSPVFPNPPDTQRVLFCHLQCSALLIVLLSCSQDCLCNHCANGSPRCAISVPRSLDKQFSKLLKAPFLPCPTPTATLL